MGGQPSLNARLRMALRRSCADTVRNYEAAGMTRSAAVAIAASMFKVSGSSVWRWLAEPALAHPGPSNWWEEWS